MPFTMAAALFMTCLRRLVALLLTRLCRQVALHLVLQRCCPLLPRRLLTD